MTGTKHLIGFVFAAMIAVSAFAGEQNYSADAIPAELKKGASAVIRNYHEEMQIVSAHEIYINTTIAVTILDENGKKYGVLGEMYDKFRQIERIDGRLYDKNGKELQKLKQRSIKDYGPNIVNFFDDHRFKTFDFEYSGYPYTCVYEVRIALNNSFSIPSWSPRMGYDCSVEKADIKVAYPKTLPLRYRTFHIKEEPSVFTAGNTNKLTLAVSDIHAGNKPDGFTPAENYYDPTMVLVADKFEIDGRAGSMATWRDFGKFFNDLNTGRDELSGEVKKAVHALTDSCHTDAQKIALLYDYLRKNTRYVSIQLGIGGWQTFDAKFVCEKGYGDCKALTNYMKSLLKEAGITGYYALVYAGDGERHAMMPDFPHNQFNHVILCVPGKGDTTWLECTAKDLPVGYLSSFTSNRLVLLVTPDGGYPVKTPEYGVLNSTRHGSADIYFNDKDEMHGTIRLSYSGYLWDNERHHVTNEPKSNVDGYLNSKFPMPDYSVSDYQVSNDISREIPTLSETIDIKGGGMITRGGKNLFLSIAVLPLRIQQPLSYDTRKHPFHIHHSYMVTDTITFHLIGRYRMTHPKEEILDFPFSNYHLKAVMESDSVLKMTVSYTQEDGDYLPELFTDYIRMSKIINNYVMNDKIVLAKKEE